MLIFSKFFFLGVALAIPLGPMGLFLIQQTLVHGLRSGLAVAVGIAGADAVYGGLASCCAHAVVELFLHSYAGILKLLGKALLLLMALSLYLAKPTGSRLELSDQQNWRLMLCAFIFTLANPATILIFMAVFFNYQSLLTQHSAQIYAVLGVFLGSLSWFSLLSYLTSLQRTMIDVGVLAMVQKCLALCLVLMAVWPY